MSTQSLKTYTACIIALRQIYGNNIPKGMILRMYNEEMKLLSNN